MQIGAQLYTVREYCNTLEGFSDALQRIADIGYKTVQISGTCDYEPEWLRDELKKNGLRCVLTHTSEQNLIDNTELWAKKHDIFDCDMVGLGHHAFDGKKDDLQNFFKVYTPVVEKVFRCGKYFMYHNHASEFIKLDGKPILLHIAEHFSPQKAGFTLDTYWVQVSGGDSAQWIKTLKDRVPVIHLKDCAFDRAMSVIGEGNINFDRVFQAASQAGTRYMLVEQDDCNGENPFDCLKRSYDFLKSRGFA